MTKVLVIHGRGLERRGYDDIERFGTLKLPDYERIITGYADETGLSLEFFHSTSEDEVVACIESARDRGVDAILINPGGFSTGAPKLTEALSKLDLPRIEVHFSNPARYGTTSSVAPVCTGTVTGFGVVSYKLALAAIAEGG
jgi:3-dehydroquinate dehydratase II